MIVSSFLSVNAEDLARTFSHHPLALGHKLVDHPALTAAAIAALAGRLPARAVEVHESDQPRVVPGGAADRGVPAAEALRDIAENRKWMVLWFIEQVREYREILYACVREVAQIVGKHDGGVCPRRQEAFLFVSSPGATTPVHFDPEQNLLLQIAGTKKIWIGEFGDAAAGSRELLRYYDGGHRNLERMPGGGEQLFHLRPEDGVYIPPFAPHWVQNGPEPSISLSLTFRSRASERRECVYELNSRLRRLGFQPRPPGEHGVIDRIKTAALLLHRLGKSGLARLHLRAAQRAGDRAAEALP